MSIIQPKVLKGFRDFLPTIEIERKRIQKILEHTFESFGFVPIDTPALEYTEVLLGKGGGETDKQVYRFTDNGNRDVSMRFDLTVPFARYIAAHKNELYLPFKRYHISKVWRGENTQRGRYREFTQCDFDIVGVDSVSADFEILLMMYESLSALGVNDVTISISHRGIFSAFLKNQGIEDKNVFILRTVDKLAKIGAEKVKELLCEELTSDQSDAILSYIQKEDSFEATLEKLTDACGGSNESIERVSSIYKGLKDLGIEKTFTLDPSITRGLDYYTGIVYETFLNELPSIGSVCSGGRYNNLASLYTKDEIPGVGASIGLDRLMAGLEELGKLEGKSTHTTVMVLNMDEPHTGHYHKLAGMLRKAGIPAEVFPVSKKFGPQFKFAEKKGIPFALICGENEYNTGTVNVKNLEKRENYNGLTIEEAVEKIKTLL